MKINQPDLIFFDWRVHLLSFLPQQTLRCSYLVCYWVPTWALLPHSPRLGSLLWRSFDFLKNSSCRQAGWCDETGLQWPGVSVIWDSSSHGRVQPSEDWIFMEDLMSLCYVSPLQGLACCPCIACVRGAHVIFDFSLSPIPFHQF